MNNIDFFCLYLFKMVFYIKNNLKKTKKQRLLHFCLTILVDDDVWSAPLRSQSEAVRQLLRHWLLSPEGTHWTSLSPVLGWIATLCQRRGKGREGHTEEGPHSGGPDYIFLFSHSSFSLLDKHFHTVPVCLCGFSLLLRPLPSIQRGPISKWVKKAGGGGCRMRRKEEEKGRQIIWFHPFCCAFPPGDTREHKTAQRRKFRSFPQLPSFPLSRAPPKPTYAVTHT